MLALAEDTSLSLLLIAGGLDFIMRFFAFSALIFP